MNRVPREGLTTPLSEARGAAAEQARRLPVGLIALAGGVLALLLVVMFVVLDYGFDQAPHRLVKILLGATVVVSIVMRPRFGLWVFALATPFLLWMPQLGIPGVNPLNVLLYSIIVSFALTRIAHGEPVLRGGSMTVPLVVMLVLMGLSILRGAAFPVNPDYSAASAAQQVFRAAVTLLGYFVALMMLRGGKDRHVFSWAIVVALLLEALVTIKNGRDGSGGRALGSIGQANELGTFFALYVVVAAALLPAAKSHLARLTLLATLAGGMVGVFYSVSRGALIAVAVGLLFVVLRSSRWLAMLMLLAMISSPLWIPEYMVQRFTETEVEVEGTDVTELEGSAQARIDTWTALTEIISEHPLDGVGFTGLFYVLPEVGAELGLQEVKDSSHNTWLRFQAELGILGLLVLLWVFWRAFRVGLDGIRLARSDWDRQLGVGLAAAALVLALSCAFGDRFFAVNVVGNFWILCALVDTIRLDQQEKAA